MITVCSFGGGGSLTTVGMETWIFFSYSCQYAFQTLSLFCNAYQPYLVSGVEGNLIFYGDGKQSRGIPDS